LRTAFFGTSSFAVAILRRLADTAHRPALVLTPPDRPQGRGRRLGRPPVAQAATELELELEQIEDASDAGVLERVRASGAEAGVVCAFGQIIREPLLSELCLLNVHPSLLPRWRGAAPIERAILAGDEWTGVTIMRLAEGLDSGPIALAERVAIGEDDFGRLAPRLERLGGELLVRALDSLAAGELELVEQDDSEATYAEKIRPEERRLDLGRPAPELARLVRALTPQIGAYLELAAGERLGVRAASAEPGALAPGELLADGDLLLGCSEGVLRIREVQPAGRKPMSSEAYLRGNPPPRLG
jgi:methionyl-tRNA formyltransferase